MTSPSALEAQSARLAQVRDEWRWAIAWALVWLRDRARQGDAEAGAVFDRLDSALTACQAEGIAAASLLAEHGR